SAAARIVGLHRAIPALRRFALAPVAMQGTRRTDQALSAEALASELDEAVAAGEREGVLVDLSEPPPLPPCAGSLSARARRLFAGVVRAQPGLQASAAPACADCALGTRCTITHDALARSGFVARAITDASPFVRPGKNPGTRLKVLDERDVEKFFHVDY